MSRAKPVRLLVLCAAVVMGSCAQAQTKCSIDGGSLAFGDYHPGSASVDVMGLVTLQCNGNYQVQLSLSVGTGSGANFASGRVMTGPSGTRLVYNIYTDASHLLVLGDGTDGSTRLAISGHNLMNQVIYGRIMGGQRSVIAGVYVDTLVATVSY